MKKSYKLIEDPEAIAKALLSEEERRSLRRLAEAIADKCCMYQRGMKGAMKTGRGFKG